MSSLSQLSGSVAAEAFADTPSAQNAVVTGRVLDTAGKPISGAFIAAYDPKSNVVSSAHTNAKGEYSLAVPRSALHVDRKGKTFFTQVSSNFNRAAAVATTLIPVAHLVSEGANAVKPAAEASSVTRPVIVVDSSLAPDGRKAPSAKDAQKLPGALMVKVVAPGYRDLTAVSQAYWIQQEQSDAATDPTIVAWLDSLLLARDSATKSSSIGMITVATSQARLLPALVKHGDKVQISALLTLPTEPRIRPVLIARDSVSGEVWEMKPSGKGKYTADIFVDDTFKPNDHIISILAYADSGNGEGRRADLEAELIKVGVWNLKRPFVFNPLLLVSRNRMDLVLTVVP